ncbi:hypothetical protein PybrP1_005673 [[Pythium] brassicae (nom. inval.)]|nr:hypothetical protein PybrP1_005673 [[Pythium] brassicae (nom. inval.)]
MNDPLASQEYHGALSATWESYGLLFVQRWWCRDSPAVFPGVVEVDIVAVPAQRDGFNCGVLCIAQASSYINSSLMSELLAAKHEHLRDWSHLRKETLQALRLPMLYEIMRLSPEKCPTAPEVPSGAEATYFVNKLIALLMSKVNVTALTGMSSWLRVAKVVACRSSFRILARSEPFTYVSRVVSATTSAIWRSMRCKLSICDRSNWRASRPAWSL